MALFQKGFFLSLLGGLLLAPQVLWACIAISPYVGYQNIFLRLVIFLTFLLLLSLLPAWFIASRFPRTKKIIRYFMVLLVFCDVCAFGMMTYFEKKNDQWIENRQNDVFPDDTQRLDC